jgi:hypothetical protein
MIRSSQEERARDIYAASRERVSSQNLPPHPSKIRRLQHAPRLLVRPVLITGQADFRAPSGLDNCPEPSAERDLPPILHRGATRQRAPNFPVKHVDRESLPRENDANLMVLRIRTRPKSPENRENKANLQVESDSSRHFQPTHDLLKCRVFGSILQQPTNEESNKYKFLDSISTGSTHPWHQ